MQSRADFNATIENRSGKINRDTVAHPRKKWTATEDSYSEISRALRLPL